MTLFRSIAFVFMLCGIVLLLWTLVHIGMGGFTPLRGVLLLVQAAIIGANFAIWQRP